MKFSFARPVMGIVTALLLACSAHAVEFDAPLQKITGAEQPYALGELVDLNVSQITRPPQYFVSASYTWTVYEPNLAEKRVRQTGDGVFFGAGVTAKKLKAQCAATYLYIVKENDKVVEVGTKTVIMTADIVIGDVAPDPNPGPNPTPDPAFDTGKYDLSKWSYGTAKTKVKTSAKRAKAAQAIAANFNGIAASIAAGTLKDPATILKQTHDANVTTLTNMGISRDDWVPFFNDLQNHVYDDLWDKKAINTADDFATAWKEIARGLIPVP